jgi:hypothetical protein
VDRASWSAPTSPEIVQRRASGRRFYNALRKAKADLRRNALLRLLKLRKGLHRGDCRALGKLLGCCPQTVSNDLRRLGLRFGC